MKKVEDYSDLLFFGEVDPKSYRRLAAVNTAARKLRKQLRDHEADKRDMVADMLSNVITQKMVRENTERLHTILRRVEKDGWIHYTRLAVELDYTATNVHRYFKPAGDSRRSTPTKHAIPSTMDALAKLLRSDAKRMREGLPTEANVPLKRTVTKAASVRSVETSVREKSTQKRKRTRKSAKEAATA